MNAVGPLLLLATGAVTLRLTLSGAYTSYVRVGMSWLLVPAALVLLALGLAGVWRLLRSPVPAHRPGHGGSRKDAHDHGSAPGVALLLLLPLLVAYVVSPPSLGAFSAARSSTALADDGRRFAPLEIGGDGVADLEVAEAVRRARADRGATLTGRPVRFTGFVVPAADGSAGRFLLTRFVIRCCAADGTPAQLDVALPAGTPDLTADAWVEVVATYEAGGDGPPRFSAASARQVQEPDDPYET